MKESTDNSPVGQDGVEKDTHTHANLQTADSSEDVSPSESLFTSLAG